MSLDQDNRKRFTSSCFVCILSDWKMQIIYWWRALDVYPACSAGIMSPIGIIIIGAGLWLWCRTSISKLCFSLCETAGASLFVRKPAAPGGGGGDAASDIEAGAGRIYTFPFSQLDSSVQLEAARIAIWKTTNLLTKAKQTMCCELFRSDRRAVGICSFPAGTQKSGAGKFQAVTGTHGDVQCLFYHFCFKASNLSISFKDLQFVLLDYWYIHFLCLVCGKRGWISRELSILPFNTDSHGFPMASGSTPCQRL